MPVIGARELQPVNILGSYVQGLEMGRTNQLAMQQRAAAEAQAQRQLRQDQMAEERFASEMATQAVTRRKTLLDIDTENRKARRDQANEAIQLITAANPRTYPQIYRQAIERYGAEELAKMGVTEQYDPELLGTLGRSMMDEKTRIDQSLRAREARAAEGRLAADQTRALLDARRLDLEARRVAVEELKASPDYRADTLDAKTRATREKAYPNASAAYRSANNDIDRLIQDLNTLSAHPGLSAITGGVQGRLPSLSKDATAAQALLDKILAKGQFRSLQALRDASPTGGAVGNVSDKEGQALRDSFGALSQTQQDEDFREQIKATIGDLEFSKRNISAAFNDEYAYRVPAATSATPVAAPVGKSATPSIEDLLEKYR